MADLFTKTEKYFNDFYSSVKDNYRLSAEEFNPDNGYPYRFKVVKEEHRFDLYFTTHTISRFFGLNKSLLELDIPENFATPRILAVEIINYRDSLIKKKKEIEGLLPEYASIEYEIFPIEKTLQVINEVVEVLNYALSFEEIKPYLPQDLSLYNLYIRNGDDIKIKHCLDVSDVNKVLDHIREQKSNVVIDGKLIPLNKLETIQIYDTSSTFNKNDKGELKKEMEKYKAGLRISGLSLLKHCGVDVTHKFPIPEFNTMNSSKMEQLNNNNNTNRIFISHSSKDEIIVNKFIDLVLILGMGLDRKDIFCTSTQGANIKSGLDFKEVIKKELVGSKAVIQIITRNYKTSEVCLNEMGAAWIVSPIVIPIVADPFNYDIGFIHSNSQQLKLNSHEDLIKLYDDHKKILFPNSVDVSVLNKKITEFTAWVSTQTALASNTKTENIDLTAVALKMISKDYDIFKVKNRKGLYLKKGMIYHSFPDDITFKLMGYHAKEPVKEISSIDFEKMTKGQNLQSVHGAELVQERLSRHYWIILNNKRRGIPDVDTINYLVKSCSCKTPSIVDLKGLESTPQDDDLISIKKFVARINKSGW